MTREITDAVTAMLSSIDYEGAGTRWSDVTGRSVAQQLADVGWLGVGLPADLGGQDGELADAIAVVEAVTAHGYPSPAADLLLVTNTLILESGLAPPAEVWPTIAVPTLGRTDRRGRITLSAASVPWATWARSLLVPAVDAQGETTIALVDAPCGQFDTQRTLHGTPWATVHLESVPVRDRVTHSRSPAAGAELVVTAGALARSVQLSVALGRVRDLTIEYARTREQFGRPIARFQAIQQHLAELAGLVATAQAAVTDALSGTLRVADLIGDARLSTAKSQTSTAAGEACRISHQVHGAMGITVEHELHRHTLALWSWRDEFGDEFSWGRTLATDAMRAHDLWAWMTCTSGREQR